MKILITGANGLLGSNLCLIYSKIFGSEVIATSQHQPDFSYCQNFKLDINDKEDLVLVQKIKPDLVVHCAALTNIDYCEEHPEEAEKVIVQGTKNIALAARKAGSFLVHISTDAVFDGERGNYSEKDRPNPINVYARAKLEAEKEVQKIGESAKDWNYAIIRTNIYGWNRKDNQKSLAEWMLDKLEKGEKLPAFEDVSYSPILVNNLAEAILELYELKFKGTINIAGSESCSKFDFAMKLAEVFGLDKNLIVPTSVEEMSFKARRPKDMSLDISLAQKVLKTKLLNVEEGLCRFKDLRERRYLDKLRERKEPSQKKTPKKYQDCFIIIPALNEENTLENVLFGISKYIPNIIVVDDCSKDKTREIAERYALVIRHDQNKGYDQSLNDGFKLAREKGAKVIVTMDADGQHFAEDLPKMIGPVLSGEADIVVGRRPYPARFMETIFARYGWQYGINDPLCGFKAYSIKVYEEIGFFDTIKSIGTQLAFTASRKGYRVKEVPIQLRKRQDVPRFGRKLKANFKLFLAYLRVKKYLSSKNNF